eukprot:g2005.t1
MSICNSCCGSGRISSRRVISKYGEWETPSEQTAESSTLYFRSHHELPIFKTRVGDLHEFGEGHTLYFFFLQSISRLFFLIFIISGLPTIVVSLLGSFYKGHGLDAMTIGSVGHFHEVSTNLTSFLVDSTNVENEQEFAAQFRQPSDAPKASLYGGSEVIKEDAFIVISMLDAFGALLFFCGVLWLSRIQRRLSLQVESTSTTVADYSICVENLPSDTCTSELVEFFSHWGDVISAELVKTDCELIERARIDRKLADDMKIAVAYATRPATKNRNGEISALPLVRIKILELRKAKADNYTRRLYAQRRNAKAVCAFVTMDRAEQRLALIETYPNSFGRRLCMRREKRFRRTHRIKALPAPEPADIIWENLQFRFTARFSRRFITTLIKYLALALGFLFINLATSMRHNNPASMSHQECDAECGYFTNSTSVVDLTSEQRIQYKECYKSSHCDELESSCYQCYCELAIIEGLNRDDNTYCQDYLADFATASASEAISTVGVVFTNLALAVLATKLSQVERHHTRIGQETSLAHTLFVFQFINTAISYLVATTSIPRLRNLVKGTALEDRLFVGVFVDTTPNWYREVGRSLTITMIVQSGTRFVRVAARWLLFKWKYCWRGRSVTQNQLNDAYMGPDFALAPRYGELLNLIFVTMFFGGGIPMLYLVTAISFLIQFHLEKAELLRLSQRPPSFGPDLAEMVGRLLPYATLWHFVFSAWSFSFQNTSRSPLVAKSSEKMLEWIEHVFSFAMDTNDATGHATDFGNRLMQVTSAHHVILFILIALILLIKVTMSLWLALIRKVSSLIGLIKDTGLIGGSASSHCPDIKTAIRSGILIGPTSYALKSNPRYITSLPTRNWDAEDVEDSSDKDSGTTPLMTRISTS